MAAALNLHARDSYTGTALWPAPGRPDLSLSEPRGLPQALSELIEITVDKLRYSISTMPSGETVATLVGWADSNDYTPHLVIPDFVPYDGSQVPVTSVNKDAFIGGWGITALTIGANVRSICESAFYDCSITELTVPSSVISIGIFAFGQNPLTKITFENAAATSPKLQIGAYALASTDITTFEVPARLAYAGEFSFKNEYANFMPYCHSLKSITINPAYGTDLSAGASRFEIIEGALCISSGTEAGRKVGIVAYPCASNARTVLITDACIDVYKDAFSHNPTLESIVLSATSPRIEGKVTLIADKRAFSYCGNLSTLSFSANGPIRISARMAEGCYSLEAYTLADNITNLKTFDGIIYGKREGLRYLVDYPPGRKDREVTIPEDVKYIAEDAFFSHTFITTLTLPQGLLGIEDCAFLGCYRLKNIIYSGSGLAGIGGHSFTGTPFIDEAPAGPVMLGDWMVGYSGTVPQALSIGPEVRHAVPYLFDKNQDVRNVTFKNSMADIPEFMFYGCANLTKVSWPAGLKTIGYGAFYSCGLEEAYLPEGVTTVMPYAFNCCPNLQTVSLPSTLTALGAWSFYQEGDNTIREVTVNRATPPAPIPYDGTEPTTDFNAVHFFSEATKSGATLVLPQGVDNYAFTRYSPWNFTTVENRYLGGIDSVTADNYGIDVDGLSITSRHGQNIELWRMDGLKLCSGTTVTAPCAGIYILRHGSMTTKLRLQAR